MDKLLKPVPSLAVLLLCLGAQPAISAELAPPSVDILAWPRMTSQDFGCYLEKTFGYKDKRFNCSLKHYKNKGDVCNDHVNYYEGPAFPEKLATKVHPLAQSVELTWEHGDLQSVTLTLKGSWSEKKVRKVFRMPRAEHISKATDAERSGFPENVMYNSVDSYHGTTSVGLVGFDHMGGGDFDCGDGK